MARYLIIIIAVCALLLSLYGCSKPSPPPEVAEKLVADYYGAMEQGDVDKAVGYFTNKRAREMWQLHVKHILDTLGTVKSFSHKRSEINTTMLGRIYTLTYVVDYSSGKRASETVAVSHQTEDGELAIISHEIIAEGFKPAM